MIKTAGFKSANPDSASVSRTVMHLSSRMQFSTLLMLSTYQLLLLYAAHQGEHHHRPTVGCCKNEHTTQISGNVTTNGYPLNTAASLWWISALGTPSVTRNLIIIRCSCCMPTSSVDILNNNDVINDVEVIIQGVCSTQYMSQLQHIE